MLFGTPQVLLVPMGLQYMEPVYSMVLNKKRFNTETKENYLMMKQIISFASCSLLVISLLSGCGTQSGNTMKEQEPSVPFSIDDTGVSENVNTAQSQNDSNGSADTIDLVIKENHQVHAKVYAPDQSEMKIATVEYPKFDPEQAFEILCPQDQSAHTTEHDEVYQDTIVTSENGLTIRGGEAALSLSYQDENINTKYDEMCRLLEIYAIEHPDEQSDLSFMTRDEAIAKGKQILKDLGINLQPEVETCSALDHVQLQAYQKELLAADAKMEYPKYDPFDNVPILENLTEADDSYRIKFYFSYNGVPVYGPGQAPSIRVYNNSFPPFPFTAELMISGNEITYFTMNGAFRIVGDNAQEKILTAEEAVNVYAEKWGQTVKPIPEETWQVNSVYLEYLPKDEGGNWKLIPYWCIVTGSAYTDTRTGEKVWSNSGERFNAITGEEYGLEH